jgi:hypothetical protein
MEEPFMFEWNMVNGEVPLAREVVELSLDEAGP